MSDLIKTLKSSETGNDVYPNIKEENIPDSAVKTAKINDSAVTNAKLGDSSVTTAKIQNGAVTTAKIEDEGVSTAKIENGAVTTAKIDTGAVTSNKLADSSVTSVKINNGAVSYDKLATAVKDLIDGKQSKIDSSHKLDADLVDDSTSANKFVTATDKTTWSGKQDAINSTHKLDADLVDDSTSTNKFVTASDKTNWNGKQAQLISGTNIKTINNQSLLGSGNIDIQGGSSPIYIHNLILTSNGKNFIFTLFTNSATPITSEATLITYMEVNKKYMVNGAFDGDGDVNLPYCIWYDGSEINVYVTEYNNGNWIFDSNYGFSIDAISDNVTTISGGIAHLYKHIIDFNTNDDDGYIRAILYLPTNTQLSSFNDLVTALRTYGDAQCIAQGDLFLGQYVPNYIYANSASSIQVCYLDLANASVSYATFTQIEGSFNDDVYTII